MIYLPKQVFSAFWFDFFMNCATDVISTPYPIHMCIVYSVHLLYCTVVICNLYLYRCTRWLSIHYTEHLCLHGVVKCKLYSVLNMNICTGVQGGEGCPLLSGVYVSVMRRIFHPGKFLFLMLNCSFFRFHLYLTCILIH